MSGAALAIVLASAFVHAGWSYLLKRSDRKIVFIWWFQMVAVFLFLPMFLYHLEGTAIPKAGWLCIVGSGVIHAAYFWFMGGAYQRGDLSLVYPLSRGAGPLFVPILAVILLREEISPTGAAGILMTIAGIYCIHLRSFSRRAFFEPFLALRGGASLWALCTGLAIAAYSLVDKVGIGLVPPPVYLYLLIVVTWLTLTPWILIRERERILPEWTRQKTAILWVGFLSIFNYLMILYALQISKVSYVAAVREVSIVLSTYVGIALLGEKHGKQKMLGALLTAAGVVAIGLSR